MKIFDLLDQRTSKTENTIIFNGEEDVKSFSDNLVKNLDKSLKLNVYIKNYKSTDYKSIEDLFKKLNAEGFNANLQFDMGQETLKVSNVKEFSNLEDKIKALGNNVSFTHDYVEYSLDEIVVAQKKLNDLVEKIKKYDASPFEKYLIIYNFLTSKIYKENEENRAFARDIIAVMNSDSIVCVGYSEVLKYLCDAVGIKCQTQNVTETKKNGEVIYHQNNLVYIDDEKYNIHGWYYTDSCWDSVQEGKEDKKQYIYCLTPMQDKDHLKNKAIRVTSVPERYYYKNRVEEFADILELDIDWALNDKFEEIGRGELPDKLSSKALELLNDNRVRQDACKKLISLLKQENVPENIYTLCKNIPQACSYNVLLSKLILNKNCEKEVVEGIRLLKSISSGEEESYKHFCIESPTYITNVYNSINEYSNLNVSSLFDAGYLGNCLENMIKHEYLKSHYGKDIKEGKPVSIETFKKGLKRVYEIEGNNAEKAGKMTTNAIEYSLERALIKYNEDALNCFSQEAQMQKANQQS